jgi:hypothetical protein
MTWKEVIEEVSRLPQDFRNLKAIIMIDTEEENRHKLYDIVEICSRGLGGLDDYLGFSEDDPRNNYEYDISMWTEPSCGENRSYSGMTWEEIIENFSELPKHFGRLDAVIAVDTAEESEYKYYKIVGITSATFLGRCNWINPEFSDRSLIIAEAEPTERESLGSLIDERDEKIDSVLRD